MIIASKAAAASSAPLTTQAIISTQSAFVYSTKDGVTFTLSAATSLNQVTACGYFENKWLISGSFGTIAYSDDDLTTWTSSTGLLTNGIKRRFVTGGSTCVAVGDRTVAGSDRYHAVYSTAIATWTSQDSGLASNALTQLEGAATNGTGTFTCCGDSTSGNNFYSTTNLTSGWTSRTTGLGASYGTAFGASLYVVGGIGGGLYTSSDLATWTSRTSQTTQQINSIAFGNSLFVLVGNSGAICTSTNGTTWTARTSGTTQALNDVQYAPGLGLWIACGDTGTILTSADAITWTSRSIPSPGYSLLRLATKP